MPKLNDDRLMEWKTEKHSVAISTDCCSVPGSERDSLNKVAEMVEFFEIGDGRLESRARRGVSALGSETRGVALRDDQESVILVDSGNNVVGSCGKLAAHREGKLHRAFSILITNQDGELLLQRRAAHKYHFASRWSNTCCGHPRPGEPTLAAARRRLAEELGFDVPLEEVTELRYRAVDPVSGLIEYEHLHVLQGRYSGEPCPNPDEVGAVRWMPQNRIRRVLARWPDSFTPWFAFLVAHLTPDREVSNKLMHHEFQGGQSCVL